MREVPPTTRKSYRNHDRDIYRKAHMYTYANIIHGYLSIMLGVLCIKYSINSSEQGVDSTVFTPANTFPDIFPQHWQIF